MQLHEAIRKARKERGMTQQQLADLAGIERKQLSILEGGGNVTLATVRKVLPHLPNMPAFTLGGIPGNVERPNAAEAQAQVVEAAARSLETALRTIVGAVSALAEGRVPAEEDAKALHDANRDLFHSLGIPAEDYDRELEDLPPQEPLTDEEREAAMAALREAAKEAAANLAALDEEEKQAGGER
jgi:transcriptional regulator with XRE-family HTH domain